MTLEKATKDMQALVAQHGFNYEGELTYDGRQIFTRRWTKKTQVVWYGESESTLEIKISICGKPHSAYWKNAAETTAGQESHTASPA